MQIANLHPKQEPPPIQSTSSAYGGYTLPSVEILCTDTSTKRSLN
jgi:hypothetical protein